MSFSAFLLFNSQFIYETLSKLTKPGIYADIKSANGDSTNIIVARYSKKQAGQLRFDILSEQSFYKTGISVLYYVLSTITLLEKAKQFIKRNNYRVAKISSDENLIAYKDNLNHLFKQATHEYTIASKFSYFHMKEPVMMENGRTCLIMRNLRNPHQADERDFFDTLINERACERAHAQQNPDYDHIHPRFQKSIGILKAVAYCHTKIKITLGDIKLENFITKPNGYDVFVVDFATAQDLTITEPVAIRTVTHRYAPPEAYQRTHPKRTTAYDAFSTGVVLALIWDGEMQSATEHDILSFFRSKLISLRDAVVKKDLADFDKVIDAILNQLKTWQKAPEVSIALNNAHQQISSLKLKKFSNENLQNHYASVEFILIGLITPILLRSRDKCKFPNDEVKNIVYELMAPKAKDRITVASALERMYNAAKAYYEPPMCLIM